MVEGVNGQNSWQNLWGYWPQDSGPPVPPEKMERQEFGAEWKGEDKERNDLINILRGISIPKGQGGEPCTKEMFHNEVEALGKDLTDHMTRSIIVRLISGRTLPEGESLINNDWRVYDDFLNRYFPSGPEATVWARIRRTMARILHFLLRPLVGWQVCRTLALVTRTVDHAAERGISALLEDASIPLEDYTRGHLKIADEWAKSSKKGETQLSFGEYFKEARGVELEGMKKDLRRLCLEAECLGIEGTLPPIVQWFAKLNAGHHERLYTMLSNLSNSTNKEHLEYVLHRNLTLVLGTAFIQMRQSKDTIDLRHRKIVNTPKELADRLGRLAPQFFRLIAIEEKHLKNGNVLQQYIRATGDKGQGELVDRTIISKMTEWFNDPLNRGMATEQILTGLAGQGVFDLAFKGLHQFRFDLRSNEARKTDPTDQEKANAMKQFNAMVDLVRLEAVDLAKKETQKERIVISRELASFEKITGDCQRVVQQKLELLYPFVKDANQHRDKLEALFTEEDPQKLIAQVDEVRKAIPFLKGTPVADTLDALHDELRAASIAKDQPLIDRANEALQNLKENKKQEEFEEALPLFSELTKRLEHLLGRPELEDHNAISKLHTAVKNVANTVSHAINYPQRIPEFNPPEWENLNPCKGPLEQQYCFKREELLQKGLSQIDSSFEQAFVTTLHTIEKAIGRLEKPDTPLGQWAQARDFIEHSKVIQWQLRAAGVVGDEEKRLVTHLRETFANMNRHLTALSQHLKQHATERENKQKWVETTDMLIGKHVNIDEAKASADEAKEQGFLQKTLAEQEDLLSPAFATHLQNKLLAEAASDLFRSGAYLQAVHDAYIAEQEAIAHVKKSLTELKSGEKIEEPKALVKQCDELLSDLGKLTPTDDKASIETIKEKFETLLNRPANQLNGLGKKPQPTLDEATIKTILENNQSWDPRRWQSSDVEVEIAKLRSESAATLHQAEQHFANQLEKALRELKADLTAIPKKRTVLEETYAVGPFVLENQPLSLPEGELPTVKSPLTTKWHEDLLGTLRPDLQNVNQMAASEEAQKMTDKIEQAEQLLPKIQEAIANNQRTELVKLADQTQNLRLWYWSSLRKFVEWNRKNFVHPSKRFQICLQFKKAAEKIGALSAPLQAALSASLDVVEAEELEFLRGYVAEMTAYKLAKGQDPLNTHHDRFKELRTRLTDHVKSRLLDGTEPAFLFQTEEVLLLHLVDDLMKVPKGERLVDALTNAYTVTDNSRKVLEGRLALRGLPSAPVNEAKAKLETIVEQLEEMGQKGFAKKRLEAMHEGHKELIKATAWIKEIKKVEEIEEFEEIEEIDDYRDAKEPVEQLGRALAAFHEKQREMTVKGLNTDVAEIRKDHVKSFVKPEHEDSLPEALSRVWETGKQKTLKEIINIALPLADHLRIKGAVEGVKGIMHTDYHQEEFARIGLQLALGMVRQGRNA